jgi:hypothetical protein
MAFVRFRLSRPTAVFACALVLLGCTANPPSPTPAALPGGGPSELCPEVDLRSPEGERLNLTDTWLADDFGMYYMTQRESCLHWLGMSPAVDDAVAGDWWTNVYVGQIGSDFRVYGEFADVPYRIDYEGGAPNSLELGLAIGFFDDAQGDEWPALHVARPEPQLGGWNWVPIETMPPREEYVATYRNEGGCPSIEMNGQQYELNTWSHDVVPSGQLIDQDGRVVARPGDQLRIEAQVWPDHDTVGCLPLRLLAWEIEPLP